MSATPDTPAPILSIVGKSDAGKTTLIEKLLVELTERGWRVATIKRDAHSFEVDYPGKDSYRHREAGAAAVVVSSATRLFLTVKQNGEEPLSSIRDRYLSHYDLVLTEGYRRADAPKIEVHREACSPDLLCDPRSDNLIAVVSDRRWELPVPVFDLDDAHAVADFIEETFLKPDRAAR